VKSWLVNMRRGHRALRVHNPLQALRHFERALMAVPTTRKRTPGGGDSNRAALADLYYYVALCLRKVGLRNRAVGSLVEAARLQKRGSARRKLACVTNDYGMAVQNDEDRDDRQAFYGVQFLRYIRSKKSHKLGTRAESDMIVELVDEYWGRIKSEGLLDGLNHDQRLSLFRNTEIVFPFLSVPEVLRNDDVAIDFYQRKRVGPEDRCVCGSGLPYKVCHGRTPGIDEILTGKF
jgi:SEC-C motif